MRGRNRRGHVRRGAALLEALVALVILTVAGATIAALGSDTARAVRHVRAADDELRRASAYLDIVVLWTRDDLDRRLGDHEQYPWRLRVDRAMPTLYTLTLTDSLGARVLLRTALFRPEPTDVAP